MTPIDPAAIQQLATELEPYTIAYRRHVHGLAELSEQEVETSAFIRAELDQLGIPCENPTPTSVLGVVEGAQPGGCVALRADIDALPIVQDPCNLAGPRVCTSRTGTTSHACGHDGHTAMLLTAARALARLRDERRLAGTVLLCFESAEETMSGFTQMLDALEKYPVETAWGIHLYAGLPSGQICVDAGPRMAGAAEFDVTVHGTGGHGSRPDMAHNPVFAAANLLSNLAVAWVNRLSPLTPVTLGPTSISGGDRFNVFPEQARVLGSLRFFDAQAGTQAIDILRDVAEHTCAMLGCTAEVRGRFELALPVVNDERASELAKRALEAVLPAGSVVSSEPWYGSESFGHYLRRYPGVFAHLGIANPACGSGAPHHTPPVRPRRRGAQARRGRNAGVCAGVFGRGVRNKIAGGGRGIRTLGTGLPLNGFQDRRIKPLCHPSARAPS